MLPEWIGQRVSRLAITALVAICVVACGSPSPSQTTAGAAPEVTPRASSGTVAGGVGATPGPTPSGQPVLGIDWRRIYGVDQPAGDPLITPPPAPSASNRSEHPGRYTGGMADLMDVTQGGPGLVAAGFYDRGPQAMVWTSVDGQEWSVAPGFPAEDASLAYAVAAGPDGLLAGGVSGSDAAIWSSSDGLTWERIRSDAFHDETGPLEVRAITWTDGGWLAAGLEGGIVNDLQAAFWHSADGRTWERMPEQADFAGGRVEDLAVGPGGIVAVGSIGSYRAATEGAVWRSDDGLAWERVPASPALAEGMLRGVTTLGDRFAAVGASIDATEAAAWTSEDGVEWARAPTSPALENFGAKIVMQDVTNVDGQLVAGGHLLTGTQYPQAGLWRSADGLTWERAPHVPALAQGLVEGIAPGGPGVIAVGTFGSPDLFIPTVWISPAWPDV